MSNEKFAMLYSIYSWPNFIMSFVGGFLLDSVFGIRLGTTIYMILAMIGQLTFATGVYINAFWLMIVGRLFFGIGSDTLTVAQNMYAVLWFKGKELNMVFGLQLCLSRAGSTVNFLIMEKMYSYISNNLNLNEPESVGIILFFASLIFVVSMISVVFLNLMDRRAEMILKRNAGEKVKIMKLQNVKEFRDIFWLATSVCVIYYMSIFPFLSFAKLYFITKYDLTPAIANTVTSLVFIISAVASPLFGILIDKTGKNTLWIIINIIGSILAHGLFAFTYLSPYVCMIILALSFFVFASSFWPLIADYVHDHQLGTAYGITVALVSLGLAVAPTVCGIIVDKSSYFWLEIFFLCCLFLSLAVAIFVWILERKSSALLSITKSN